MWGVVIGSQLYLSQLLQLSIEGAEPRLAAIVVTGLSMLIVTCNDYPLNASCSLSASPACHSDDICLSNIVQFAVPGAMRIWDNPRLARPAEPGIG